MKRLVLFLDGTWNKTGKYDVPSNVARLKELVESANTDPARTDTVEQRLYYDSGVGTKGSVDQFLGGWLGFGLSEKVRAGYRFLSQFYQPSDASGVPDEIYLFGFSRGSFTARSLAGFIAASGLLRPEFCSAEGLAEAWSYYRTDPKKRLPAVRAKLSDQCYRDVKIHFLGVFDTVGSTGIPLGIAKNWAGSRDRFHDTKLGSAIVHAVQALAIDEHRGPFVPALFARPDHLNARRVEQVWFPGVHADIGGGYPADAGGLKPISEISLAWMVGRVRAMTDLQIETPKWPTRELCDPHDSLGPYFVSRLFPMYRLLDATELGGRLRRRYRPFAMAYPDRSWKEAIHRSVFDLMIATAGTSRRPTYRPPQVDVVAEKFGRELPVIDHDGSPMSMAVIEALLAKVDEATKDSKFLPRWKARNQPLLAAAETAVTTRGTLGPGDPISIP
ncbi:DUF2235 domain-containing protein [Prosthecomicrobium hirschii]|uniref:DUF2235 domain-containing protein n=1 Tax=Prosthecodimorpha hirschii TaxID=665126 RepID=UPI00221F23B8|nr:DUF2235 domain-containing protein [Prosthecomicrobium hirschii]MCW1839184.1 DUF2235 domain-containing protein [Prosthecomicrobium hirschii]